MKLLLIGQSVLDTIDIAGNKSIRPGGVYYSAFGLNLISDKNDFISLVTQVDNVSQSYFKGLYDKLDCTHTKTTERIPNVHLTIFESVEREERYLNYSEKLDLNSIDKYGNYDGVLINMITGSDISLEDLINIRKNNSCPIYFDIHSLSRKLNNSNIMEFVHIPEVEKWLSQVDIIQANKNEINSIMKSEDDLKIADFVLSFGPKYFIITRGMKGSTIYWKSRNRLMYMSLIGIEGETINKVGCGDLFGAIFFYSYLVSKSVSDAMQLANKIAGLSTKTSSLNELLEILVSEKIIND